MSASSVVSFKVVEIQISGYDNPAIRVSLSLFLSSFPVSYWPNFVPFLFLRCFDLILDCLLCRNSNSGCNNYEIGVIFCVLPETLRCKFSFFFGLKCTIYEVSAITTWRGWFFSGKMSLWHWRKGAWDWKFCGYCKCTQCKVLSDIWCDTVKNRYLDLTCKLDWNWQLK